MSWEPDEEYLKVYNEAWKKASRLGFNLSNPERYHIHWFCRLLGRHWNFEMWEHGNEWSVCIKCCPLVGDVQVMRPEPPEPVVAPPYQPMPVELDFDPSAFWLFPDWDGPLKEPFWMRPPKQPPLPEPRPTIDYGMGNATPIPMGYGRYVSKSPLTVAQVRKIKKAVRHGSVFDYMLTDEEWDKENGQ